MPFSDGDAAPREPLVQRSLSLRETVLERLRTAIITGRLGEGDVLSTPALGARLGVSATPVREAMMDLVREGLVESVKNKGFRVTSMSETDLDDLAQIRLMLEPPAMRIVAGRIPEEDLPDLLDLAHVCLAAAENDHLEEYLRFDREFHARVLQHTGNAQLVELATSLRRRTRLYGIATVSREGRLHGSAREHLELLDLLAAGDGGGAERVLHRHISHARALWATAREES
ncbi:GntR family transcriptional regulator [Leucobacter chromiiresistens]|uniref:GntR family transcriptional regulator n=1 Tax=Leucobacter chromiiresistens TaxID=1079994 RepID=A0A147EF01_9MICO|nr:GntR family transcriptional regulator [Leucobacter chromiiresistens]KTR82932.1 GntR family transcriptional regulator [Leucobacter chromiiresistens]